MTALSAFLRKTPGEALREYFDRPEIGLPTEFDWPASDADLSGPLLGAIEQMSRVQRDRISNDAERVHGLSDEPGQAAIYSVAEDPALLDGLANPHARSLWMFLNAQNHTISSLNWKSADGSNPFKSEASAASRPHLSPRIRLVRILKAEMGCGSITSSVRPLFRSIPMAASRRRNGHSH